MKYQKVEDENDPQRCQGTLQQGQCRNKAIAGSEFCPMHARHEHHEKKRAARNYNLTAYQARLDELVEAPAIMSLREEIAILRMLLERRLNSCQTDLELQANAMVVSELITKIEKVLSSCHRLEASTGLLLDKPAALALGNKILEIIANHIEDEDTLDTIASEILHAIVEQKPLPKTT